ncbi:MAG: hypothetical protein D3916_16855, partial [Candidatus Electrothrix sp. MAN1_4]|nr:hypothetical protein [Candidatus Electrothrix sp. MAN1_4]
MDRLCFVLSARAAHHFETFILKSSSSAITQRKSMGLLPESLSFIHIALVNHLYRQLNQLTGDKAQELHQLRDDFTDPLELARFYVEPSLQACCPLLSHSGVGPPDPQQPKHTEH